MIHSAFGPHINYWYLEPSYFHLYFVVSIKHFVLTLSQRASIYYENYCFTHLNRMSGTIIEMSNKIFYRINNSWHFKLYCYLNTGKCCVNLGSNVQSLIQNATLKQFSNMACSLYVTICIDTIIMICLVDFIFRLCLL